MTPPAVDPEIRTLLETADTSVFPVHGLDTVLADPKRYALLRDLPEVPTDDQVKAGDLYIHGPGGTLRLRIYRPETTEDLPVILYIHGGAYTYGSPEAEEGRSLRYARDARAVVVSVDYRLAPEHPFPAATDDAYAVLTWIAGHAAELGGDPARIAVAGGSAGGNIAASTALRARDQAGPRLLFQALTYPGVDGGLTSASVREFTDTPVLNRAAMELAWRYYTPTDPTDPYASPLHATDLTGLPPRLHRRRRGRPAPRRGPRLRRTPVRRRRHHRTCPGSRRRPRLRPPLPPGPYQRTQPHRPDTGPPRRPAPPVTTPRHWPAARPLGRRERHSPCPAGAAPGPARVDGSTRRGLPLLRRRPAPARPGQPQDRRRQARPLRSEDQQGVCRTRNALLSVGRSGPGGEA